VRELWEGKRKKKLRQQEAALWKARKQKDQEVMLKQTSSLAELGGGRERGGRLPSFWGRGGNGMACRTVRLKPSVGEGRQGVGGRTVNGQQNREKKEEGGQVFRQIGGKGMRGKGKRDIISINEGGTCGVKPEEIGRAAGTRYGDYFE